MAKDGKDEARDAGRRARLAEALRANLKRRKAGRSSPPDESGGNGPPGDG